MPATHRQPRPHTHTKLAPKSVRPSAIYIPLLFLPVLLLHLSRQQHALPSPPSGPTWTLATTIQPNKAQYLPEWIAWHFLHGAVHIFLYDVTVDGVHARMPRLVKRLARLRRVTIVQIEVDAQIAASGEDADGLRFVRDDMLKRSKSINAAWAAYWDSSEYLFVGPRGNLQPVLERFRNAGALWLPRKRAGTSGKLERVAQGDLAVTTYLDLERDDMRSMVDHGRCVVRIGDWRRDASGVGRIESFVHPFQDAVVNAEGVEAVLKNGVLSMPFSKQPPFLIRHVTRSYAECLENETQLPAEERNGVDWMGMRVSICKVFNPTTGYYPAANFTGESHAVAKDVRGRREDVCAVLWSIMDDWCRRHSCCEVDSF